MQKTPVRWFPTKEQLLASRWLKPLSGHMANPALWRMTRRSVRFGVAIGLFSAFILPVGQIPLAILISLPFRANMLVASTVTLVTNPITFPFLYFLAYRLGARGINLVHRSHGILPPDGGASLQGVFGHLAIGLTLLAIGGFITRYFATDLVWRHRAYRRWVARSHRAG